MHIKVVPVGQILALALLIILIGIGIIAMLKKVGASSKARKRMFWGSIIAGVVVALIGVLGINGLFSHSKPYTWDLYPWQIVTILKLAIIALAELGCMAVFAVVWIVISRLVIYVLDKLPPKVSKWYHNLVKQKGRGNMVRTEEFISWTRPDDHSTEVDKQINAYIREHDRHQIHGLRGRKQ